MKRNGSYKSSNRYTDKYKGHNMVRLIVRTSVGHTGPTATTSVMLLPTVSHIQKYFSSYGQHLPSMIMTSEGLWLISALRAWQEQPLACGRGQRKCLSRSVGLCFHFLTTFHLSRGRHWCFRLGLLDDGIRLWRHIHTHLPLCWTL